MTTNIWKQMSYVPPRGPCGYKASLVSPACACLRFMIHPVKAATSFDCDGCSHHASYHKMENKAEEEILLQWKATDDRDACRAEEEVQEVPSKRQRVGTTPTISWHDDVIIPEIARTTLVGPGRKRNRPERRPDRANII